MVRTRPRYLPASPGMEDWEEVEAVEAVGQEEVAEEEALQCEAGFGCTLGSEGR